MERLCQRRTRTAPNVPECVRKERTIKDCTETLAVEAQPGQKRTYRGGTRGNAATGWKGQSERAGAVCALRVLRPAKWARCEVGAPTPACERAEMGKSERRAIGASGSERLLCLEQLFWLDFRKLHFADVSNMICFVFGLFFLPSEFRCNCLFYSRL